MPTTAPGPSARTDTARAPLTRATPLSRKSSSSTAATSASRCGSTCWRLTIKVTREPRLEKMWANSTPVTPDPTITRCSGSAASR